MGIHSGSEDNPDGFNFPILSLKRHERVRNWMRGQMAYNETYFATHLIGINCQECHANGGCH